ncbi:MAG: tetratricopeptide repeat protein, partial [Candidatus Hodarchaeota archaeon]
RLVDINEEYLGKVLNSCFSVFQTYADLKAVIGDTARSHALLARFLNGKGMWEEAKKEFLAAINLEPDNPGYCSDIAHALLRRGDVEQAIYWWQKQKEVSPRDKWVYLSLTNAFVKLRRFDDALKELRDLITLYPENMNHKAKLIRTLLASGRLDEAIDEYYKVMEGNQNLSKSTYDAIREYRIKGDYAKAIKILNESLTSALKR